MFNRRLGGSELDQVGYWSKVSSERSFPTYHLSVSILIFLLNFVTMSWTYLPIFCSYLNTLWYTHFPSAGTGTLYPHSYTWLLKSVLVLLFILNPFSSLPFPFYVLCSLSICMKSPCMVLYLFTLPLPVCDWWPDVNFPDTFPRHKYPCIIYFPVPQLVLFGPSELF